MRVALPKASAFSPFSDQVGERNGTNAQKSKETSVSTHHVPRICALAYTHFRKEISQVGTMGERKSDVEQTMTRQQ
jgi:hypothetical protein